MKTVRIKLKPTKEQAVELRRLSKEYIHHANQLVQQAVSDKKFPKVTSKDIPSAIPSAVKNELIRYAQTKYTQFGQCVFKKLTVSWNNQNYSILSHALTFPIMVNGKAKKTLVRAVIPEDLFQLLSCSTLGAMRIKKQGFHWIAQVAYEEWPVSAEEEKETAEPKTDILGVDLGILCPAVGVVASTGKTKFFGNGRYNKKLRRKYKQLRRELGKKKKLNALKRINDKEARIMRDINHKISRHIVEFAVNHHCGTIKLEDLSGIRRTSKAGGKHKAALHNWTFFELATFITYKAQEARILVEKVKPDYTSQTCPACGERHKPKGRRYACGCGYHSHRDRVGALNIASAPTI